LPTLINLGCKLNQYEGFCLIKKFGHIRNLVIVNTCCVTREAVTKSLKKFRQAIKKYPQSTIIATGCTCRLYPEKFSRAHHVIDTIQRLDIINGVLPAPDKSRYFLKIQDGCTEPCTFCIVSKIRNRIQSKSLENIKTEIQWAQSLGYKEIVLVGANIGLYGVEREQSLVDVLRMLKTIEDLPRIRLSSIEPRFISEELIEHCKEIPFCRHFHIPIQSADNTILSFMGRSYDRMYLERIITMIKKYFADVSIGADIIVGFPFESEQQFLNTYHFIESSPITHLHIFPYSVRPGTAAEAWDDTVPFTEKKQRLWRLRNLINEKNFRFRQSMFNQILDVIVEEHNGTVQGVTDNYIRVHINNHPVGNKLLKVRITDVHREYTCGSPVS
jgi:threonylcarbamoyladenosine tRNA methylthiotransferase MtaB